MASTEYNPVFDNLVQAPDDIEGFIAYGLYKQAKREWLLEHQAREGKSPSPSELRAFSRQWSPTTLQAFRETAESALSAYAQSVLEDQTPSIQRDALLHGRPLWKDVLIGVVSALSYSVILVIAAFLLKIFGNDFMDAVTAIRGKQ
ncbi:MULTISPECIES: hypothetical protein [unclassified Caulobacter]|jgi:hypothetical protein|uniref:hypothetical protein n=1 Tax=unclassified Caulobacter TaxID=2648921 RepID=UPI00078606C4|nr:MULTISPECIES: hypothetical protein [unclassified Caulobacter]AZS22821.1 hypothetical protein CSW63_20650 [Caulobacter sp. FWC26]